MGQMFLKGIYLPQNATSSHNFNITTGLKQKYNERNQLQEFFVSWTLKKATINSDQSRGKLFGNGLVATNKLYFV